jgi:hypothetical protein
MRGRYAGTSCEEVFAPRPKRDATRISPSETPVTVELDLVEPLLAFRQVGDRLAYMGSMNFNFSFVLGSFIVE